MKELLEITIPTHSSIPSAPSCALIKHTVEKLFEAQPKMSECHVIVSVDCQKKDGDNGMKYVDNLHKFADESPFNISIIHTKSDGENLEQARNNGQIESFMNMTRQVKTPFLLHWEHDWVFTKPYPDMENIIDAMQKNEKMKVVFFNKRTNEKRPADWILQEPQDLVNTELKFLETARYSNNPHIAKREFWQEFLPTFVKLNKHKLERLIFFAYRDKIRKIGFEEAHSLFGAYLYGGLNQGATIKHIDGNKWKGKQIEKR